MSMKNLTDADHKQLNNEEFKEAFQSGVTQTTQEYLASIGQEYVDKYNYLDQVLADLQAKGITAVVYAALPSPGAYEDSEAFYFFHNWNGMQKFAGGKATVESMITTSRLNHMLIQAFMNWFVQYICRSKSVHEILTTLWGTYGGAISWWSTGKIPGYVQKQLSEMNKES